MSDPPSASLRRHPAARRALYVLHTRAKAYIGLSESKATTLARISGALVAVVVIGAGGAGAGGWANLFFVLALSTFVLTLFSTARFFWPARSSAGVGDPAGGPDAAWVRQVFDEAHRAKAQMEWVRRTILAFGMTVVFLLALSWLRSSGG